MSGPAWHEQAVELYAGGMTLEQVGAEFGVTRERVRQVLEKFGVGTRGRDGRAKQPVIVRLLEHIEQRGEHWIWTGYAHNGLPSFVASAGHRPQRTEDLVWNEFRGPLPFNRKARATCGVFGCVQPAHLSLLVSRKASVVERFMAKVRAGANGCVEWTDKRFPFGYGNCSVAFPDGYAHRTAWILFRGPIPDGLFVLHRCDNPPCCNPEHLFLGTAKDNAEDRDAKGRGQFGPNAPHRARRPSPTLSIS